MAKIVLGAPFLQDKLDRDDGIAAWPPRVEDHAVNNGHRAHDVEPYLYASVTGAAVAAALGGS